MVKEMLIIVMCLLCDTQQELSRDAYQWLLNGMSRQHILLSGFLLTSVEQGGKCNVCPVTAVSREEQEELESVSFHLSERNRNESE